MASMLSLLRRRRLVLLLVADDGRRWNGVVGCAAAVSPSRRPARRRLIAHCNNDINVNNITISTMDERIPRESGVLSRFGRLCDLRALLGEAESSLRSASADVAVDLVTLDDATDAMLFGAVVVASVCACTTGDVVERHTSINNQPGESDIDLCCLALSTSNFHPPSPLLSELLLSLLLLSKVIDSYFSGFSTLFNVTLLLRRRVLRCSANMKEYVVD